MNKKKLLQKGVAFSILLPFSCGIALPAIDVDASKKSAFASTYSEYEYSEDDFEICLADTSFCTLSAVSSEASTFSSVSTVVSKVNLNVRSSPSTSGSILGTLKSGESAEYVGTVGDWYQIVYEGSTAYVSASSAYSYIQSFSGGASVVESLVSLNVRSTPSTSGTKVGLLSKGETAVWLATNGSWHTILFEGSVAYVSASTAYSKVVVAEADSETTVPEADDSTSQDTSSGKVVTVNATGLNVRSSPSTSATVYAVVGNGETFDYISTSGSWYAIDYYGKTAYVSASYCTLKDSASNGDTSTQVDKSNCDTLIMSCVDSLNVRSSPSTSSTCVGSLDKGDMVSFTDLQNGWYETVYKGQTAYVSASDVYTSLAYFETGSEEVEEAIDFGYTLLGTPYVYGATRYLNYDGSVNSYFTGSSYDCSSMVQYIYASTLGIELGSTSRLQSLDGVEVAASDIKRGDLLFFTNSDRYYNTGIERIGHVAIYLGNNYILHTASDHAVIEEISDTRWKYFITARDVISSD